MRDYTDATLTDLLPYPADDAHKYSRGKLTVVGGSVFFPGAAALAALASQRMGAGYVEVCAEDDVVNVVQGFAPSLVVRPWSAWDDALAPDARAGRPCACILGCGLDIYDRESSRLVQQVLAATRAPVVVDGGALGMFPSGGLASRLEQRARAGQISVITPHAGEAATLAEPFRIALDDPSESARALAKAYHAVCVLKGPDTVISDGQDCYTMTQGSAALAKAGTGDVLAGMIGALLAQGLDVFDSCVLGATLHARAGVLAAEKLTAISVTPEDVIACIPDAIAEMAAHS